MKKYNLFKIMLCTLLVVLIGTYFIPGRSNVVAYMGLGEIAFNSMQAFYYFYDLTIFIVLVGGLYGVLNKTAAYKKLLDTVVSKVKPKANNFIIGSIVLFALVTALTGISMPLFIFIPFVVSIILLLGYDKLVALSSTVGAIIIGLFGCIFLAIRQSSSSSYSIMTLEEILSVEKYTNVFPKLFLLIAGIGVLIWYVLNHIKTVKDKKIKYEIQDDTDIMITEIKGSTKKVKMWTVVVCFGLLFILLVLGLVPWYYLFKVEMFDNFHTWLIGIKIGDFALFDNIISARIPSFGMWDYLGGFTMVNFVLLVVILLLKLLARIKLDEVFDGFLDGAKKLFGSALITTFAYTVLICAYNNGFFSTIAEWAVGLTKSFNLIIVAFLAFLGSFLHIDLFYTTQGAFVPIFSLIEDSAVYPVLDIVFQSMYAVIMLFAPTSLLLIVGLSYLRIPYKIWLKYIYRLAIILFILATIVSMLILVI